MNCGCGEVNERHKPGDIVLTISGAPPRATAFDVEQAADNIHSAARKLKEEGSIR